MVTNASERRGHIVEQLRASAAPVSGTALAREAGVSRQVIVQDIALLRADGNASRLCAARRRCG